MGKAGRLDQRVGLDQPTVTPDQYGGQEHGWTQRFEGWAEFIHLRGSESVDAARLAGKEVYRVKLRSSPTSRAITPGWRLRDLRRGTEYNVRSVDAVTDRAFVYLTVESGVAV